MLQWHRQALRPRSRCEDAGADVWVALRCAGAGVCGQASSGVARVWEPRDISSRLHSIAKLLRTGSCQPGRLTPGGENDLAEGLARAWSYFLRDDPFVGKS